MQNQNWSVRMADSVMRRNAPFRWHYESGLMHKALEQVWQKTGDSKYYETIASNINAFVSVEGNIKTYSV